VKMARRTGRPRILALEGAFHGRTMGALAMTAKAAYREPFEPLPGHVTFVPYGDAAALEAAVDETTAAIVVEPIQGEAGVVVPPDGFLRAARDTASRHGALLWLDEVQTGMGRTGDWLAHTESGIRPDIVTLAKGLGGGIPIGATVALGEAATLLEPGNHGTTFGGNPVACAAALAVFETIEKEGLLQAAVSRGEQLTRVLISEPGVTAVEGRGLLLGAQLAAESGAAAVARAQEAGFLLNNTGPARLRFAPPLTITEADVASLGDAWARIVTEAG
jgi:acetylornithine/N-succinyldiaminopimelate aminotransferase